METPIAVSILICVLTSGAAGSGADSETSSVFVLEPQDAWVRPGGTVQLDCELTAASQGDICAWRIAGTQLGVDHFYNVAPPDKVRALFPEHERVCSILIEDADRRHDGLWTCWPLANTSHVSSRDARLIVADETTLAPTSSAGTTTEATSRPAPTTTPADTTTEPPRTSPEQTSTSPAPPTTTPRATTAPPTSPEDLSTTTPQPPQPTTSPSPGPDFVCPLPNGLFADPTDPRYFYYCQDGIAVRMQCEWPKLWNDAQKTCV